MISSTGKPKSNRAYTPHRNGAGYTLIELVLTTLIILVLIGLSTPMLKRTYTDLRVNLQAKDMAGLTNLARERAVLTRIPHAIALYVDKDAYGMLIEDEDSGKFIPLADRWGKRFKLHDGLSLSSDKEDVRFFADGTSSGAKITIEDVSGTKAGINIDKRTGEITVATEE